MNDDELRRAFHSLADGDLPPGFPDRVLASLPDRRPVSRQARLVWAVGAFIVAAVLVATVVGGPLRIADEMAPRPPQPSADPSDRADGPMPTEEIVLTVEMTPGGFSAGPGDDRPNTVVFSLEGGRAVYRDYGWGSSRSEERVAYLTDAQVEALVAFAIGPGGMADADAEYPRDSLGPSGQTIIALVSPQLTKTVTYGLAPGNLTRDKDPALGGLPELVDRLGHFSAEVERGDASGGLALTDVDRATSIALADPRFDDLLAPGGHSIERVIAANLDGTVLVFLLLAEEQREWPEIDVCESGQASGDVTGVVWLVNLAEGRVSAVSPRWGSFDCLNPLYDEFVLG